MENNTNTQTEFRIYRDGELDRGWLYRKQAKYFLRKSVKIVGHGLKLGLVGTINVVDEMVQSVQNS